jgi:hypothetical protein
MRGTGLMSILTLRFINGDFVVTAPHIEAVTFKSRHAAKSWCTDHHPGSQIIEVGQGARNGRIDRRPRRSEPGGARLSTR